eukprot:g20776.t1
MAGRRLRRTGVDMEKELERYMERHPCILDQAASFLGRNPWLYQLLILSTFLVGCVLINLQARQLGRMPWIHNLLFPLPVYLYCTLCANSPGKLSEVLSDLSAADASFCEKCQQRRPGRAHHCRVCGECILLMDHHCVWLNQCVGERNLRQFCLFLFYTTLYSLVVMFLDVHYFFLAHSISFKQKSITSFLFLFVASGWGLYFAGYMLARQVFLIYQNKTGVEFTAALALRRATREGKKVQVIKQPRWAQRNDADENQFTAPLPDYDTRSALRNWYEMWNWYQLTPISHDKKTDASLPIHIGNCSRPNAQKSKVHDPDSEFQEQQSLLHKTVSSSFSEDHQDNPPGSPAENGTTTSADRPCQEAECNSTLFASHLPAPSRSQLCVFVAGAAVPQWARPCPLKGRPYPPRRAEVTAVTADTDQV